MYVYLIKQKQLAAAQCAAVNALAQQVHQATPGNNGTTVQNACALAQVLMRTALVLGTQCPNFGHYRINRTPVIIVTPNPLPVLAHWLVAPACPITAGAMALWAQLAHNVLAATQAGAYAWLAKQVIVMPGGGYAVRLGVVPLPPMPGN
jgi:hypothetical protein